MKIWTRLILGISIAWVGLRMSLTRAWLRRPGRVSAMMASIAFLVWGLSLFASIGVAVHVHPLIGASIMCATLFTFVVAVEPWLACTGTGSTRRPRHDHRLQSHGGVASHRSYLHRVASQAEPSTRLEILSGLCPWLLAYWIEDLLDPKAQARHQAQRLRLNTPVARSSQTSRSRL